MKHPLYDQLDRLSMDRWARSAVRIMLRAIWLSLSVWCLSLAATLLWDWPLQRLVPGGLALALLLGAVLLLFRPRMRPLQVARRLDRRFRLNEQLSTALEVASSTQEPGLVAGRLLDESGRTAAVLRRRIDSRSRPPWVEVGALVAMGLVLLGLSVLVAINQDRPSQLALPIPELLPPDEAPPPPPDEPFEPPQPQPNAAAPAPPPPAPVQGGQSAADRLADALRDQAPTREAAAALDQGDTQGAAQALRELADQADDLSRRSRQSIGDQLRDAADDIQNTNPQLADQLRQSANGLEQGGQAAAQALDELARAVEGLDPGNQQSEQSQGQQPQGQQGQGQQPQSPGGSAPSNSSAEGQALQDPLERLGTEGVPLELDGGEGNGSPTGNADRPGSVPVPPSSQQNGLQTDDVVHTGEDPLSIPADLRDVVQEYFSPED